MQRTFHRDRFTWLAYLSLAFYGYFLNVLGPITPFLKDELHLSYTVSSYHFTAFAVGILIIGVGGHIVIERIGHQRSLWTGIIGLSLGALLLVSGRNPVITVGASFLMGLVGSLILAIVPAAIFEHHGELQVIALPEANVLASLFATSAPLMVGWFASSVGDWRWALRLMALLPIVMFLALGKDSAQMAMTARTNVAQSSKGLPTLYWIYWTALVLGVSVEFCMIYWGADYLEQVLGMMKTSAAQGVSLFLAGMIVGRILGSRLVQRFSTRAVVTAAIVTAGIGFMLFWKTASPVTVLFGMFTTGLGVANFYPLILTLAISAADGNTVQAGARATLASGTAILAVPLALGWLADALGIRPAYGIVLILLISVYLITQWGRRKSAPSFGTEN